MRIAALVILALAAAAAAKPDEPEPARLEDPCLDAACTAHALDAWRTALGEQRAGNSAHPLRVSYVGDSLTADDHITDALRKRLQALVGDGGAGFVFAAPPHPYCQHRAVARIVSDGWIAHGVSTIVPPDHLLGLGGDAETDDGGTIRFVPTGAVHSIDVHYLAQPHGGSFELVADGKPFAGPWSTAADRKQGKFAVAELPDGTRRIELRARGRVRLFGATLEAITGGVVDNLGVVNATAKAMRTNNLEAHWQNQLAHRGPDLVVVMYGTNEAEWLRARSGGMAEHEQVFGELLGAVRAATPQASCLVVSPLDQLDWHVDTMPPRDSVPAMVDAQRRAATSHGCAFWDVYTWMGGKGASRDWQRHGFMAKDFQHPTSEGAERIALALFDGLVAASGN